MGGACGALLVLCVTTLLRPDGGGESHRLRHDLVTLSESRLVAFERVDARLAALESQLAAAAVDTPARDAVAAVADDVRLLRDSLELELRTIDDELMRLKDSIAEVVGAEGGPDPTAPLDPRDEPRWVVLARSDRDAGVRFSALVRLGRRRTDRSVAASLSALDDEAPSVVWAALRNLGAFRERSSARAVAALLEHAVPVVRLQAYESLVKMGLPDDLPFDPVAPPGERKTQVGPIRAWAEE